MSTALIALAAAGVLLLAAVVVLLRRASALTRDLNLVGARLGLGLGGLQVQPDAISAALDRREAAAAGLQRDLERLREALDAAGHWGAGDRSRRER